MASPEHERGPTDYERAERIRCLVRDLHAAVIAAKESGLWVNLTLGALGDKTWGGYKDAAKITREF